MTERRRSWRGGELEEALFTLGRDLAYPISTDLPHHVRVQLEAHPRRRWRDTLSWHAILAPALAVFLVIAIILASSPGARTTVASWFNLAGVRLSFGGTAPGPIGQNLDLGKRVSLAEAQKQAYFTILEPTFPRLSQPDEVYIATPPVGGRVSLVYQARSELPPARHTRVGLLVTEFRAQISPILMKKLFLIGTQLYSVTVNGQPGWWIEGKPHILLFFGPGNRVIQDSIRLAGNTLLWQQGDVVVRLELAGDNQEALQIAQSMRPARHHP
jgi:hypothetical protein